MKCLIDGTNKIRHLDYRDKKGLPLTEEILGNAGMFTEGMFRYDQDLNLYRCSLDHFEWWEDWFSEQRELDWRIDLACNRYGTDEVLSELADIDPNDLENYHATANKILDGIFDEAENYMTT